MFRWPRAFFQFKIPDVKLKSEGPYQHTDIAFKPIRKSVPQEQGRVYFHSFCFASLLYQWNWVLLLLYCWSLDSDGLVRPSRRIVIVRDCTLSYMKQWSVPWKPPSVTRASFTAVAVIVLSMVLAANHATLVPVFAQVCYSLVLIWSLEC